MIDFNRYCVRCDSDQHTRPDATAGGASSIWCDCCWDTAQLLPRRLRNILEEQKKTLSEIAGFQQDTLKTIERNGFVFDDIGCEPGNWQHLAFTLYTTICEIDTIVRSGANAVYEKGPDSE